MAAAIDCPSSGVVDLEDPSWGCVVGDKLPGGSSIPRARAIPSGLLLSADKTKQAGQTKLKRHGAIADDICLALITDCGRGKTGENLNEQKPSNGDLRGK
jgi:hypothetical protein